MPHAEPGGDEFALIARYFLGLDRGAGVALGNGDDAALLTLGEGDALAVSVDSMVEGVHFPPASDPDRIAYRAVAAAVSDLAAMGARPLAMTAALTIPGADETWFAGFARGLGDAVAEFAMPLVGGDLTRGALCVTIQVMGAVPRHGALRRKGASPGDQLCVSGCLGDAAAGLASLDGQLQTTAPHARFLEERFWRPRPALALGEALRGQASAAIDVSDGLLADAAHLATASDVALQIDSTRLPLSTALTASATREQALAWALGGGEDYVLCFTLPPSLHLPEGCVRIGSVEAGQGVCCDHTVANAGYRHF